MQTDNKWTAARLVTCQLISDTSLVVVHTYILLILLYIYHDLTHKEREDKLLYNSEYTLQQ